LAESDQRSWGDGATRARVSSRPLILALRVGLLVMAGAAVGVAVLGWNDHAPGTELARYVCPMHPAVRAKVAGDCPICGMALEPLVAGDADAVARGGGMSGMPDLTAVDNIRKHRILDVIRRRSLPANIRELRAPALVAGDGDVQAIFYDDQIAAMDAGETGVLSATGDARSTFSVIRAATAGERVDRSTSRVHFRLSPGAPAPAPGLTGWLVLAPKVREVLTVPASALLQSPRGTYVLVWAGADRFDKREIEIGETFLKQGFAVVRSGLQLHDRVVSRAAFFLDAERRLRLGDQASPLPAGATP
jgi:hypothetical protein